MRAIEHNPAEIDVAPFGLRVGAAIAGLAPQFAANMSRRMGGDKVSADLAAGHAANPASR